MRDQRLPQPAAPAEGRIRKPGQVRVVAITSGKGGVGKTNITANLAYHLSALKKRVLVLDADTGLANIDLILGLTPQYNLYHVLNGDRELADTIVQGPGGIRILPSSSGILEMAELSKGQKLTLLDELNLLQEEIDFLLIDTAAGITGNVMYFNSAANEIIVVASPEPTSLTDAYALIKLLYQCHAKKRFRLLVNLVKGEAEAREVYERLSCATDHFLNLTIEYLGHVVSDVNLPQAVRRQRALAELYPRSPASRCLLAVAEKLCRERPETESRGSIEFFWETLADGQNG